MTLDSRIGIENNTNYKLIVNRFRQEYDFDWREAANVLWSGVNSMVKIKAKIARTGDVIQQAVNDETLLAGIVNVAVGATPIIGSLVTAYDFITGLNGLFTYDNSTNNLAPYQGKPTLTINPREHQYITDTRTEFGISNNIKDIITGITLVSSDDTGQEVGIDLGMFAIDNPTIGSSKAFHAAPTANSFGSGYTKNEDIILEDLGIKASYVFFGDQHRHDTGKTKTWGLYIDEIAEPIGAEPFELKIGDCFDNFWDLSKADQAQCDEWMR